MDLIILNGNMNFYFNGFSKNPSLISWIIPYNHQPVINNSFISIQDNPNLFIYFLVILLSKMDNETSYIGDGQC